MDKLVASVKGLLDQVRGKNQSSSRSLGWDINIPIEIGNCRLCNGRVMSDDVMQDDWFTPKEFLHTSCVEEEYAAFYRDVDAIDDAEEDWDPDTHRVSLIHSGIIKNPNSNKWRDRQGRHVTCQKYLEA